MIRKEVQDTINAARKTYNEGLLKPAKEMYYDHVNNCGCLIGAAGRQFEEDGHLLGSTICVEKFGITNSEVYSILRGFDNLSIGNSIPEVWQAARDFAVEVGVG